jgi:hypothetical protein
MSRTRLAALCFVISLSLAGGANAADQTYVSSTGSNVAPCSRAAPCQTFQYAHDQTNSGGQITALDAADYGPLTISQAITVRANSEEASIFVSTGNAITVNAPGAGVAIQGLTLRGGPTAGNGIFVNDVGYLALYNLRASQFQGSAPGGFGIKLAPISSSRYLIQGVSVNGNGNAGALTGGAIQIAPQGGANALVTIDGVTGSRNVFGIAADGSGSSTGMNIDVRNSLFLHSRDANIIAVTSGAPVAVLLDRSALYNANQGVRAIGSGVFIRLYQSTIAGNGTGILAAGGGSILSYGNNAINANGTDGTPGSVALK